jgi:hypothetical protein
MAALVTTSVGTHYTGLLNAEKSALSFLRLAYNWNRRLRFPAERDIAVGSSGIPGLLGS